MIRWAKSLSIGKSKVDSGNDTCKIWVILNEVVDRKQNKFSIPKRFTINGRCINEPDEMQMHSTTISRLSNLQISFKPRGVQELCQPIKRQICIRLATQDYGKGHNEKSTTKVELRSRNNQQQTC